MSRKEFLKRGVVGIVASLVLFVASCGGDSGGGGGGEEDDGGGGY